MTTIAWHTEIAGYRIELHHNKRRKLGAFAVTYGAQHTPDLGYEAACTELGSAILHALTCEGKIDNG